MQKSTTKSVTETQKLGEQFAKEILHRESKHSATVICLQGELGAGKTTFLQGFARGLGIYEVINSPTFVILKRFNVKSLQYKNFYHFDCYRIDKPEEILDLGFKEIIENPENIIAIEWPEKISSFLPKNPINIILGHESNNCRSLKIGV
jgi:tRNA threonylcarbamoyladenosine biosynthesis protein TsaE